jgi:hypothetical protein
MAKVYVRKIQRASCEEWFGVTVPPRLLAGPSSFHPAPAAYPLGGRAAGDPARRGWSGLPHKI